MTTSYNVNDIVSLDADLITPKFRGVNFKVIKVNPKTLKLQALNGAGVVNADKFLVQPPIGLPENVRVEDVPIAEHLACGTLVRLNGVRQEKGWLRNGNLGVVLRDNGDRINVAPLGGHEDRYAKLPRRMVTVIDPQTVLA
jgi:hypothetical protein